jgi:hypothetical protein
LEPSLIEADAPDLNLKFEAKIGVYQNISCIYNNVAESESELDNIGVVSEAASCCGPTPASILIFIYSRQFLKK